MHLFDQLVGASKYRQRHGEAERFATDFKWPKINHVLEDLLGKPWGCRGLICRTKYSSALMGRGDCVKSASPVTNMSSTLLGPVLPLYVAMPVHVIFAARGDCSPRLIAKTWALFVVPVV